MRITIWPGVKLSIWVKQNPEAVEVDIKTHKEKPHVRRVLSKRGWMILLVRYNWRNRWDPAEETDGTVPNSAWHSIWLHGRWEDLTRYMTTEEREHAADSVARYSRYLAITGEGETDYKEVTGLRWWRD
ncbi:hypothetical protein [Rhodococcus qingshengii]|uniref:hypothetical protein n=1 Tax=Rhodococcus qingshengii TaxID=334542 RepID=UPI0035E0FD7C